MKRLISILVLCCYTAGVLGMDVSLHFCGGSVQSISFNAGEKDGCCGKKKKKMRCCRDKNLSYKHDKHAAGGHVSHHHDGHAGDIAAVLPHVFRLQKPVVSAYRDLRLPVSHVPPDVHERHLYLLHNVFLI